MKDITFEYELFKLSKLYNKNNKKAKIIYNILNSFAKYKKMSSLEDDFYQLVKKKEYKNAEAVIEQMIQNGLSINNISFAKMRTMLALEKIKQSKVKG